MAGDPGDPEVPYPYEGLAWHLHSRLSVFEQAIAALPPAAGPPPIGALHLFLANGHRGEALLAPTAPDGVRLLLERYRQIGATGVTVSVGHRMPLPGYPRSDEYRRFYRTAAALVREMGFALTVEYGIPPAPLTGQTVASVQAERLEAFRLIRADTCPDFFGVTGEPSVYAQRMGVPELAQHPVFVDTTDELLRGVRWGHTRPVAGLGNWDDPAHWDQLIALPALRERNGCLDLHVFPLGKPGADLALRAVALARQAAEQVGLGLVFLQTWLQKLHTLELALPQAEQEARAFKRDAFAFWQPFDVRFVRALFGLGHRTGAALVSSFWAEHLFAALEWSQGLEALPVAGVQELHRKAVLEALTSGGLTATGEAVKARFAGQEH